MKLPEAGPVKVTKAGVVSWADPLEPSPDMVPGSFDQGKRLGGRPTNARQHVDGRIYSPAWTRRF